MNARCIMVQGCTSDAGKSALVTALCRWLVRRGVRVAPFKPQNMALNSAVTLTGGEIGRAQAVQAQACRLPPHTDFNPILLKPNSDTGAQVIVHGRALANMEATAYHDYKRIARQAVLDSHARLTAAYEAIVVEGAGSPAEINLREGDIANMGFAEAVDCPVILIADIDRGGVFAHIIGTLALLSPSEQARVKGFVINRFRGDLALLKPGLDWLERETGKPVLGVLPYLHGLHLEAEDALPAPGSSAKPDFPLCKRGNEGDLTTPAQVADGEIPPAPLFQRGETHDTSPRGEGRLRIRVPALPRIANHTDFDALRLHPGVDFAFVGPADPLPPADLYILPGSKSVRADLAFLRERGWEAQIARHLRYGGKLIGICGGFQMLGRRLHDPLGLEGAAGSSDGLGWLDMETTLAADKQLRNARGELCLDGAALSSRSPGRPKNDLAPTGGGSARRAVPGVLLTGYEIHAGVSEGPALARPACLLDGRPDGAISEDGQVLGTYLHGLFDSPAAADTLLAWAGLDTNRTPAPDIAALREAAIDRLADAVEAHLDTARLLAILAGEPC